MNDIDIPSYVDSQPQLFFWELDETVVYVSSMAFGILLGGWFIFASMFVGYFAVRSFQKFKDGALDGVLLHICYWAGIMGLNKHYEDSSERDFYL